MAVVKVNDNSAERRNKRGKSISAMGLVKRVADRFQVSTPSLRGKQASYEVYRNDAGRIRCNCLEFEENILTDESFRCEHILAVKYSIMAKTTENKSAETVNISDKRNTESDSQSEKSDEFVTISEEAFASGEQKTGKAAADVSTIEQVDAPQAVADPLISSKGDNAMNKTALAKHAEPELIEKEQSDTPNNVMSFPNTLRQLRQNVDPNLVKSREGWRDSRGNVHLVDYVEWHTVADILDRTAPNWSHTIRDIKQIGDVVMVIVAITIDDVTREGIGTGVADSEMGIKKAEHDALKRAAVKFGIARDLYRKESDTIEREGSVPAQNNNEFPANPIAKSLGDLVTAKQLGMIRALGREKGLAIEDECQSVMQCRTDELSKKAASSFIQHLQDFQHQEESQPVRRVS